MPYVALSVSALEDKSSHCERLPMISAAEFVSTLQTTSTLGTLLADMTKSAFLKMRKVKKLHVLK